MARKAAQTQAPRIAARVVRRRPSTKNTTAQSTARPKRAPPQTGPGGTRGEHPERHVRLVPLSLLSLCDEIAGACPSFHTCSAAAVWDPCGRASGSFQATGGHGEFTNTKYAKLGDMGSKLPKFPSGAVWKAGSVVETIWSLRANHVSHLAPLCRWSTGPPSRSAHAAAHCTLVG